MIFTIKLSIFLFLSIAHSIDDYSQRLKPWATDYQVGLETWMSFTLEFFKQRQTVGDQGEHKTRSPTPWSTLWST